MDKYYKVLYYIQKNSFQSQRRLSSETGISVGLVNAILRRLLEEEYLKKEGKAFVLSQKGVDYLEREKMESQNQKLILRGSRKQVREAVILAAGENKHFDSPIGLLTIESVPLIEYTIRYLTELGIGRICIVTGFQEESYRNYFQGRGVELVSNPRYHWTGTMASLAVASDFITSDFLLVESNQIFEGTAIRQVLECEADNAMLLVNPSGSMDEAYVELDEQGNIFRVSKDIRQMNRVDGELVGVSKISYAMYCKMMDYYSMNENPHLNYEYAMESLGRTYQIPGVRADDLKWAVIENEEHYRKAEKLIYPRICKREELRRENSAREVFLECMRMDPNKVKRFHVCGGMTNTNFYVDTQEGEFILRIPGAGTDRMIDREREERNSRIGAELGINIPNIYFNRETGVKITSYIPAAETLNAKTARWEKNMRKTAELLGRLHRSGKTMKNRFSVREEYENYKRQAEEVHAQYYPEYEEMDEWFYRLMKRLEIIGEDSVSCHNDLVAENLIKDRQGRLFLIDWEYAGMNDPMWDLAAHFLECEFLPEEEELFLSLYFHEGVPEVSREKLCIYKMCQDILWSMWTVVKEAKGEDFGTYGHDRLERAVREKEEYLRTYEKSI